MSPASRVCIVVAQAADPGCAPDARVPSALRSLGGALEVHVVPDVASVDAALRERDVDLVVVDPASGPLARELLAALHETAPPVLVVTPPGAESQAAAAFAGGAADCVARGPELPELLPRMALEQIARQRLRRERGRMQRQVRLSEKLATVGQLAASVAHEINNPLGFIHANLLQMSEYAEALAGAWEQVEALAAAVESGKPDAAESAAAALREASEAADVRFLLEDLRNALRESREGSERVRRIVRELRGFARPDPGEARDIDPRECLEATLRMAGPRVQAVADVERDYAATPRVRCNPHELEQVLLNLVMNACQAMEAAREARGGTGPRGVLRLRAARDGDAAVLEVGDTGVGIPARDRDRIFEPFYTTKDVGEGMGLGLATVFAIAERLGGRVEVESREGEGASFRLRLPAAPA